MGEVKFGVPHFYPRRWVRNKEKPGYLVSKPKVIGFDFVGLGWKTKWSDNDYRFEYNPIWSFVFFNFQICILFIPLHCDNYWESWLYYELSTDKKKSVRDRVKQLLEEYPNRWYVYNNDNVREVDYNKLILKDEYTRETI